MHSVLLSRGAEKVLAGLQKKETKTFGRIMCTLDAISEYLRCEKALVGNLEGWHSYRVGDYRILYEIEKRKLLVYVEKIEHRKQIYR